MNFLFWQQQTIITPVSIHVNYQGSLRLLVCLSFLPSTKKTPRATVTLVVSPSACVQLASIYLTHLQTHTRTHNHYLTTSSPRTVGSSPQPVRRQHFAQEHPPSSNFGLADHVSPPLVRSSKGRVLPKDSGRAWVVSSTSLMALDFTNSVQILHQRCRRGSFH
jgi:hypothetical protein